MTAEGNKPRVLTIDIETSPNIADVWGLYNQNVSLNQLRDTSRVLCFAVKWHGKSKVHFYSEYHHGSEEMILKAYSLLEKADILVHYNGDQFDIPHLNREFLLAGYGPPAPSQSVDLLKVVRKHFRFTSNKLDHVVQQLGIGAKVSHTGHSLWTAVMAGDQKAWEQFKRYNIGDVRLTESLYDRILPWVYNHPHVGLFTGIEVSCNRCGSDNVERRGYAYTSTSVFARIWCRDCGGWSRMTSRENAVSARGES